jgi:membrane protease YdiL (CAAX protease family)
MSRRLRRTGPVRSLLSALQSILWAFVWLAAVILALQLNAGAATAVLLGTMTLFLGLYVLRPLRSQRRVAAHVRLRSCRRYLPWLTVATGMKLVLGLSTLVLHDRLAARRLLPQLPDDDDVIAPDFLAQPLGPLALFLALAVMAPLIEEFAFRGRAQHTLEHAFGVVPAVTTSAIVFSVLHGRVDAVHHLAFGVFAGWVVWRTGSIWSAVYMHALNNAAAQALMSLPTQGVALSDASAVVWPYAIGGGVVGLAGLIATGVRIHRIARVHRPAFHRGRASGSSAMAISPLR